MNAKQTILSSAVATAAFVVVSVFPARAANLNATLDSIASQANEIRTEALEIHSILRIKKPDYSAAAGQLETLTNKIKLLNQNVAHAEQQHPGWAGDVDFEQVKLKAELLEIIANQKASRMADDVSNFDRKLLAAKAKGIAQRAARLAERTESMGD